MRPIDADALVKKFENMGLGENGLIERIFADGVFAVIENAPTIEAKPVRHGRWEKGGYACGKTEWKCSVCGETEWRTSCSRMEFCMFCGAKMDGKEDNAP